MLLIAVAYGSMFTCDPFTTSTTLPAEEAAEKGLDPNNAKQMLEYICQDKGLKPEHVDEVLVVYESETHPYEPEVQHHHTEFE